jgi:hypothetical protein
MVISMRKMMRMNVVLKMIKVLKIWLRREKSISLKSRNLKTSSRLLLEAIKNLPSLKMKFQGILDKNLTFQILLVISKLILNK